MDEPPFLSVDPQKLKTEERIIVAAMRVFADHPLESATLRQIAAEAHISFSSITYYFKTKENLYHTVISRVLEFVVSPIAQKISESSSSKPPTGKEARAELQGMIERMAEWIYGNSHAAIFAKIIFREHFSPSVIYEKLYEGFFIKVIDRFSFLIRVLCKEMNERESTFQAFSVIGQIIAFRIERELLIRRLGFTGFSSEEVAEIKKALIRNIFRQLGVS